MRLETTRLYREVLWAIDAAWSGQEDKAVVTAFLRNFGGVIHMPMRRYRFVEDGLTIGRPENIQVVEAARQNVSLWYRVEADTKKSEIDRYSAFLAQKDKLMFDGLAERLERSDAFSGVTLCVNCRQKWVEHVRSLPARAAKAFPE
ncbi:hypothetical protein TWF506_002932 [Arthrobotrys conoides]|uniref:Uncharacterized protein n=1 Tax=Arthrobotrys conoides TaxID=74498 RepID=A0AAN8NBZ1_9PEZI